MEKRLMMRKLSFALMVLAAIAMSSAALAQSARGRTPGHAASLSKPLKTYSKKLGLQKSTSTRPIKVTTADTTADADPRLRWQSGVNPVELSQLIQEQHHNVRRCYESQLKRNPGLEGSMGVRFKITHWGRVGKTKITDNTLGNAKVRRCIVKAIRKWRFPYTKKGGVMVELPLLFKPQGTKAPEVEVHTAQSKQKSSIPGA